MPWQPDTGEAAMRPLIAVPGRIGPDAANVRGPAFAVGQRYLQAITRAGGQGVMLPPAPGTSTAAGEMIATMSRFDALVLHGGGDVDPVRYGQSPTSEQLYGIVAEHDEIEFAALAAALRLDLPVLAICRGMQVLNVHLGGTLVQDAGRDGHWLTHHAVTLTPGSLAAHAFATTAPQRCHSVHHQTLDRVAPSLRAVGWAADGTVEAVESADGSWVLGVQWHPEDDAATDPAQQAVFDELVRRSARTRQGPPSTR
jgi:putative glutamine amidotransferase